MRFTHVIMAYFMIGVVLWGGGVLSWGGVGVAGVLIDNPDEEDLGEDSIEDIESTWGPVAQLADTVTGGGLVAAVEFISGLVSFLFWPITVLIGVGAPTEVWVFLGGGLPFAFYASIIRILRGTA